MKPRIVKDIVISARPEYQGYDEEAKCHVFLYHISIENLTSETWQLMSRYWEISNGLDFKREVKGEGVVGEQPVLRPAGYYSYGSQCFCIGEVTYMKGYYIFRNVETDEKIKAEIPTMTLITPNRYN